MYYKYTTPRHIRMGLTHVGSSQCALELCTCSALVVIIAFPLINNIKHSKMHVRLAIRRNSYFAKGTLVKASHMVPIHSRNKKSHGSSTTGTIGYNVTNLLLFFLTVGHTIFMGSNQKTFITICY
jgi:hypothetical protein